jgi:hypothetical protein
MMIYVVLGADHIVVEKKTQQMMFKGSLDDCREYIKTKTNGKNR